MLTLPQCLSYAKYDHHRLIRVHKGLLYFLPDWRFALHCFLTGGASGEVKEEMKALRSRMDVLEQVSTAEAGQGCSCPISIPWPA